MELHGHYFLPISFSSSKVPALLAHVIIVNISILAHAPYAYMLPICTSIWNYFLCMASWVQEQNILQFNEYCNHGNSHLPTQIMESPLMKNYHAKNSGLQVIVVNQREQEMCPVVIRANFMAFTIV